MSNLNKARFMKGEEITTKKSNEEILDKIRKEEFGDEYEEIQEEIIPAEEHKDEESPVYETRVEENYDEDENDDDDSQDEDEQDVEEEPEYKPTPKKKVYNRKPQKQETKVEPQSENPLYKKLLLKLKLELIEEARNTIEIDGFSESEIDMVWESILEDIQK